MRRYTYITGIHTYTHEYTHPHTNTHNHTRPYTTHEYTHPHTPLHIYTRIHTSSYAPTHQTDGVDDVKDVRFTKNMDTIQSNVSDIYLL